MKYEKRDSGKGLKVNDGGDGEIVETEKSPDCNAVQYEKDNKALKVEVQAAERTMPESAMKENSPAEVEA